MGESHFTRATYERVWRSWLARCSCGWAGSYHDSKRRAAEQARAHRREKKA